MPAVEPAPCTDVAEHDPVDETDDFAWAPATVVCVTVRLADCMTDALA